MGVKESEASTIAKSLTVKDIARLAGTSASTVSRVLTGVAPVADAKREAVLRAISDANYRPNLVARSLKTRSTHTIGLLINDILNPFYGAVARGVEDRAGEVGFSVVFCNTNEDPAKELRYLSILRDKSIDGVILAPTGRNSAAMSELLADGVALVQVDRRIPDLEASSVTVDNEFGAHAAAAHLIAAGHKRIALLTYAMRQISVAQREAGYVRAMDESGFPCGGLIRYVAFDLADAALITMRLMQGSDPPTALVAANNRIALAILRTLKDLGIRIAVDVALVVFDDIEIFELMSPSLSAVRQPAYDIGLKAADFLLEQIASDSSPRPHEHIFKPELIVRESSAFVFNRQ